MKEELIERLIRYAKIDTQSDAASDTTPSTDKQWDLLRLLEKEMSEIGLEDISIDENGYLFGTLPANTDKKLPTVGFLAHVDTATDYTGTNVNPQRIDNYDGKDISLNETTIMSVEAFPELRNYIGHTLITTDGTTLLATAAAPGRSGGLVSRVPALAVALTSPVPIPCTARATRSHAVDVASAKTTVDTATSPMPISMTGLRPM